MTEHDARILGLERTLADALRAMADLAVRLAAAEQNKWAIGGGGASGGTSSGGYYGCITSADLPAGSGGTPTSLASQTVWQISSGARANLSGTHTIYNDTGADVPSGSQAILSSNPDGTYTVVGVACTANP